MTPWLHLRLVRRIREQLQVGVRVHVDEPRADEEPVGVDHPLGRLVDQASDGGDPAARDADVGAVPRIAGAVDHAAAADQEVEHYSSSSGEKFATSSRAICALPGEQAAVDAEHRRR